MKKLFIGNLAPDATEASVRELFSRYGTVRSINVTRDIFTGKCRGFGFIEMEGHEARDAIADLDGKTFLDQSLRVRYEDPRTKKGGRRRR